MWDTVAAPYAQAITRLKQKADGRVLDYWILHLGRHFVERILEVKVPIILSKEIFPRSRSINLSLSKPFVREF